MTSKSVSLVTVGTLTRLTAVMVPRAFFRYSIEMLVTMPRIPSGSADIIASPLAISATFISAIACTEPRCCRLDRRSGISTRTYPGSRCRMRGPTEPE